MKKLCLLSWLLAFSLIFGFSGMAFAGGGGPEDPFECPAAGEYPDPDAGKFLRGEYSIARDSALFVAAFNVQLFLRKGNETHLYAFTYPVGDVVDLCALEADDLIADPDIEGIACALGVGSDFGLDGIPVIYDLTVEYKENCGTPGSLIRGHIVVRVVPDEY
jgi:hypothetical protein